MVLGATYDLPLLHLCMTTSIVRSMYKLTSEPELEQVRDPKGG